MDMYHTGAPPIVYYVHRTHDGVYHWYTPAEAQALGLIGIALAYTNDMLTRRREREAQQEAA